MHTLITARPASSPQVRLVRLHAPRWPRSLHPSDRIYLFCSLFGDGAVATPVHGETPAVCLGGGDNESAVASARREGNGGEARLGDGAQDGAFGARFDHELRATLKTTLPDEAFRSFLQTQLATIELWRAPPAAKDRSSLFDHVLLGTASASLCGAESGVQLVCGVRPGSADALAVPSLADVHVGLRISKGRFESESPLELPRLPPASTFSSRAASSPFVVSATFASDDGAHDGATPRLSLTTLPPSYTSIRLISHSKSSPEPGASAGVAAGVVSGASLAHAAPRPPETTPSPETTLAPETTPFATERTSAEAAALATALDWAAGTPCAAAPYRRDARAPAAAPVAAPPPLPSAQPRVVSVRLVVSEVILPPSVLGARHGGRRYYLRIQLPVSARHGAARHDARPGARHGARHGAQRTMDSVPFGAAAGGSRRDRLKVHAEHRGRVEVDEAGFKM